MIWSKVYFEKAPSAQDVGDITKVGRSLFFYGHENGFAQVLKTNLLGDSLKMINIFSSSSFDTIYPVTRGDMISSLDGGLFFSGQELKSLSAQDNHCFIGKCDSNLVIEWITFLNEPRTRSSKLQLLANGDLLVVSPQTGTEKIGLYWLDGEGDIVNFREVSSSIGNVTDLEQIWLTSDSSLYFGGDLGDDAYLAKISGVGLPLVGLDDWSEEAYSSSVNFYPNPFVRELNIDPKQSGILQLYDASGVLLKEENVSSNTSWSTSYFEAGSFSYRFITKTFVQSGSLVKQ